MPTSQKVYGSQFGIRRVLDHKLWLNVAAEPEKARNENTYALRNDLVNTSVFLPRIIKWLKQESGGALRSFSGDPGQDKEFLSVLVIEEGNRYSTPERLSKLLDSVSLLYDAVTTLDNLPKTDLVVAACDSGSDKSFDFLGLAKAMSVIKELLIAAFDRLAFLQENRYGKRLDLVTQSLPIIEKVNKLEADGALSLEQAEILRRNIFAGVNSFVECGAIIPEMVARSRIEPRLLLAPEPKLLGEGVIEGVVKEEPRVPTTRKARRTRKKTATDI